MGSLLELGVSYLRVFCAFLSPITLRRVKWSGNVTEASHNSIN